MIALYHERWEIESSFLALRHTILKGHVLRSGDPAGLEQELWALLTLYQLLRMAMVTAVETQPGTDPDRASFTTALETARGIHPTDPIDPLGAIGRAVLATPLGPRRPDSAPAKSNAPPSATYTATMTDPPPLPTHARADVRARQASAISLWRLPRGLRARLRRSSGAGSFRRGGRRDGSGS